MASRGLRELHGEACEFAQKLELMSTFAVPAHSLKQGQNRAGKKIRMLGKERDDQMAKVILLK